MMKKSKLIYLLLAVLISGAFQSCSNKDEDSYAEWREKNEAYIEEIKNNPEYKATTEPKGGPGAIYYKRLNPLEFDDRVSPIYTDKVKVHYKGSFYEGTVFADASDRTVALNVNKVELSNITGEVKGLAVALQNMQVGDKWEIQIPWELGYGYYGSGSIPPYSALVFEIELLEIIQ